MRATLLLLLASLLGCSEDAPEAPTALVKLRMKDAILVVESGPRYTLLTLDGAVIASDLDEHALAAHHPEAAEAVQSGRAFLDARLDLPQRGRNDSM